MDPKQQQQNAASLYGLSALAALQSNMAQFAANSAGGTNLTQPGSDVTSHVIGADAEASLIDYRGEKVAGFQIDGETMICLPQVYDLFLKNLVGGLHTVYTKLKRLDITPKVCNVEQVRALRSLGAIQPGVNRCKLIACKDFDALYQDCTSASSRPGRPPKRSPTFSGGASAIDFIKKPRYMSDTELKPSAMSTMGGLAGTGAGLFSNPQLTPQHLFPFLPFTAQQLMMSQMMAGAGGSGAAFFPRKLDEDRDDPSPSDLGLSIDNDETENVNGCINDSATEAGFPDNTLTTASKTAVTNGETADVSDTRGENCRSFRSSSNCSAQNTQHSIHDSFSFAPGSQLKPEPNRPILVKEPERFGGIFGCSSVETLLMNVLGLIELAATTAKKQEEQLIHEKLDLAKLFEEEKKERTRLEMILKEEQRTRKLYEKRWKRAKKSKAEIHNQLLCLLESQHRERNTFSKEPFTEPNSTTTANHLSAE